MAMMQSLRSSLRSATAITRASSQRTTTAAATSLRIRTLATSNSEFLSAGPHKAEREYERAVRQAREVFHSTRTQLAKQNTSANQDSLSQALNQLNHDVALAKQRYLFATLNNHREA